MIKKQKKEKIDGLNGDYVAVREDHMERDKRDTEDDDAVIGEKMNASEREKLSQEKTTSEKTDKKIRKRRNK